MSDSRCPDKERLQDLLAEKLDAEAGAALSAHVEACPHCQQALEGLAPLNEPWGDVLAGLSCDEPPPEPGLGRVLKNATPADDAQVTQAERGPGERDDGLAYLAPPRKPGHLGRLGQYEVLAVLGKGGFGTVFKAFDEKLHRVVAIKVLAPELAASGTARQRFVREAQAAAAVKSDHVVAIHNVADDAQPPYLVMEMIDGTSLEERLHREGALPLREILRIGTQAAEGLAAAHQQGLIHRDIKPGNILLENGVQRVKITDFGLARAADDASVTQSGVIAGTPMYMSPEQAEGLPFDQRSDLFSLGSVLYTMCTGRAPFRASTTLAVLKRVCEETPTPIRAVNPDVPDWLCAIVEKLQAKRPGDRFGSAREVAELLGRHLAEVQAHGQHAGAKSRVPPPAPMPVPRRLSLAGLLALLAGSFVVVAGVGLLVAGWEGVTHFFRPSHYEVTVLVETRPGEPHVTVRYSAALEDETPEQFAERFRAMAGRHDFSEAGVAITAFGGNKLRLPAGTRWWFLCERNEALLYHRLVTVGGPQEVHLPWKSELERQEGRAVAIPNKVESKPAPGPRTIRFDPARDTPIDRDAIEKTADGWKIDFDRIGAYYTQRTFRFFELRDLEPENCKVTLRGELKTVARPNFGPNEARLQFHVLPSVLSGVVGFSTRASEPPARGSTNWAPYEVSEVFHGRPVALQLNVEVRNRGEVWLKNLELVIEPLPPERRRPARDLDPPPTAAPTLVRRWQPGRDEFISIDDVQADKEAWKIHHKLYYRDSLRLFELKDHALGAGTVILKARMRTEVALGYSLKAAPFLEFRPAVSTGVVSVKRADPWTTTHRNENSAWYEARLRVTEAPQTIAVNLAFEGHGSLWIEALELWHLPTRVELQSAALKPPHPVRGLAYAPDGKTLAAFGSDVPLPFDPGHSEKGRGLVTLWEVATHRQTQSLEHAFPLFAGAFSPDGTALAAVGGPRPVTREPPRHPAGVLWDLATGKVRAELAHDADRTGYATSVAFTPDGKRLVLPHGNGNGTRVLSVDAASGKILKVLRDAKSQAPDWNYPLFPDGRKLALHDGGVQVGFVDAESGARLGFFETQHPAGLLALAPGGKVLAAARLYAGPLSWYDLEAGKMLHVVDFAREHGNLTAPPAFSRDGRLLALAVGAFVQQDAHPPRILLWDVRTGKELAVLEAGKGRIRSVAFSPPADVLAAASEEPMIRLWDLGPILRHPGERGVSAP